MRIKTKAKQIKKALAIVLNGSSKTIDRVQIKPVSTGATARTVVGTRAVEARFLVDEKDGEEAVWVESGILDALKSVADDSDVELSAGGTGLVGVDAGKTKFNLGRYIVPESADLTRSQHVESLSFETARLIEVVERVAFACDASNSHYALGGVLFSFDGENIDVVSTDGRRLAREVLTPMESETGSAFSFIVPHDALFALVKALKIDGSETASICYDSVLYKAFFQTPPFVFQIELIDGRFPEWRTIIRNANAAPITYDANEAARALNTLKTLGCDFAVFDCLEQDVVISGKTEGVTVSTAEITIPASCPGNAGTSAKIDVKFLLDFLKRVDGVVYHGIHKSKPNGFVFSKYVDYKREEHAERVEPYEYVVMPMTND